VGLSKVYPQVGMYVPKEAAACQSMPNRKKYMAGDCSPAGEIKTAVVSRWTAVDFVQFLVRVSPQHVDRVFR
jgi:hypothetical protein